MAQAKSKRNYKKEYADYHGTAEQRQRRSGRNKARAIMKKVVGNKIDGKDIDHKDKNPNNNGRSNLRVMTKKKNRGKDNKPSTTRKTRK